MPGLIKPPRWALTPALVDPKWGWFWNSDLRFVIPFWEGGGVPFNLIDHIGGSIATGSPTWGASSRGIISEINGTDSWLFAHKDSHNLIGDITLIWAGIVDVGSQFHAFIDKHDDPGSTVNPFSLKSTNDATPKLRFTRAGPLGAITHNSQATITLGKYQVFGFTQGPEMEVLPTFYIDGANVGSVFVTGDPTGTATATTEPLRLGRRGNGGTQLDGKIGLVIGAATQWTDAQHARFAADPFGPFTMMDEVAFSVPAAGFVPYPNPRYALTGGMQSMQGGV